MKKENTITTENIVKDVENIELPFSASTIMENDKTQSPQASLEFFKNFYESMDSPTYEDDFSEEAKNNFKKYLLEQNSKRISKLSDDLKNDVEKDVMSKTSELFNSMIERVIEENKVERELLYDKLYVQLLNALECYDIESELYEQIMLIMNLIENKKYDEIFGILEKNMCAEYVTFNSQEDIQLPVVPEKNYYCN